MKPRLGALLTHPVQYYSPWFKQMASHVDLKVFYAHQQTARGQALAGFAKPFEWDVNLLDGYDWRWLNNVAMKPGLTSFGGCDTPEIARVLREKRFDAFLMFGWNRKCFLQAWWAAYRCGIPVFIRLDSQLATPRTILKRALKRPIYSALLPRFGNYLSPGSRSDAYLRHYRVPACRIHRLPHMVDTERFAEAARSSRTSELVKNIRTQGGADNDTFVFLFVGKLLPKKRPLLLLQAMKRLLETAPEVACRSRLWIVGDGPLRGELESYAFRHQLPVEFVGFVNQKDLPAVYSAADCLIVPSNETWGLVVNEAFASDLPAIVSAEAGCAPELVADERTGWTLRSPDEHELARLLREAAAKARDLPRDPMRKLTEDCSYRTGTRRLLEILEGVCGTRG